MSPQVSLVVLQIAMGQCSHCFSEGSGKDNLILTEFAMALLLLILRRVNNTLAKKNEGGVQEMAKAFLAQYH